MQAHMKKKPTKHILICSLGSLICGFFTWHMINQTRPMTIALKVPLCFYETSIDQKIDAPETICITLKGPRNELARIDFSTLALHIDARSIQNEHPLTLTTAHLFLPEQIKLLHYEPAPLHVRTYSSLKSDISTAIS